MNNCNRQFDPLKKYAPTLYCLIMWTIIRSIHEGEKTTRETYDHLIENGESLTSSGLYYHLSELKNVDINEVAEYNEEGSAEKVWRSKTKKTIDLLKEKVYMDTTQKEMGL